MCDGGSAGGAVRAATPRPAPGPAVDPIGLEPVDEVVVTTLVDNVFDGLLDGGQGVVRAPLTSGMVAAPQFESGRTTTGLRAEHGFSALVTVRRGSTTTTLLFDTGISPDGMTDNADRLGIDLREVQGLVLSAGRVGGLGASGDVPGVNLAVCRGARSLSFRRNPCGRPTPPPGCGPAPPAWPGCS
jgi:7,8-dihydropterin-6-yl-methyl-4-(beta-D-ribofuranosyl)aminobenzene 5'-phosphate synthase